MSDPDEALADLLGDVERTMWILTVASGEERSGCLMGFATQTAIDPARFLACVSRTNHTFGLVQDAEHVAVHAAPADDDLALARLFGEETGDEVDKFAACAWHPGPEGQPVLDGVPGWFVGRVEARHDLGDHLGLVLAPVAVEGTADGALCFSRAQALDPGHPA